MNKLQEWTWVHKAALVAFLDVIIVLFSYLVALLARFDFKFPRYRRITLKAICGLCPSGGGDYCSVLCVQTLPQCVEPCEYI